VTSLDGRAVLLGDGTVAPATVRFDGPTVAAVDVGAGAAPDRIICPGFVDLQVNGYRAVDVASADGAAWDRLDAELLQHGVTSWFPTLVSAPLPSYAAPLARIATAASRVPGIAGVHLEGPFLGGAPGAHRPEHIRAVEAAFLDALPSIVRIVTMAPEAGGAVAAIAGLRRRGVLVSLGHSTASYETSLAAIDAGAGLVTHLFNGMASLHHRGPGLVGAALTDDRVAVSVIADGVHVALPLLRLAFRVKGRGRVVLVSDAVAWERGEAGPLRMSLVDGVPRLPDGTLAGSALTLDAAIRTAVRAGVSLAAALEAATSTPADLVGLTDRGRLLPGRRADAVVLTPDLEVTEVWVAGRCAWSAP
jgi:N-acetylglucosamine-6-phosphate deacetylase